MRYIIRRTPNIKQSDIDNAMLLLQEEARAYAHYADTLQTSNANSRERKLSNQYAMMAAECYDEMLEISPEDKHGSLYGAGDIGLLVHGITYTKRGSQRIK